MVETLQVTVIMVSFITIIVVGLLEKRKAEQESLSLAKWIEIYPLKACLYALVVILLFFVLQADTPTIVYGMNSLNWTPPLQNFTPVGWHKVMIGNITVMIPS